MKLNKLKPARGSRHKRLIVGRGPGSGKGKTSGRGQNGQGSRSGGGTIPGFEGGQMPIHRRIPKRGFVPAHRKRYQEVSVARLSTMKISEEITPALMAKKGLVKKADKPVKILGTGDVKGNIIVSAHAFTRSAKEKIEKAGGTVKVLD